MGRRVYRQITLKVIGKGTMGFNATENYGRFMDPKCPPIDDCRFTIVWQDRLELAIH